MILYDLCIKMTKKNELKHIITAIIIIITNIIIIIIMMILLFGNILGLG